MKSIILYLFSILALITYLLVQDLRGALPGWIGNIDLAFRCVLAGGYGGCVYCLRGVYLNACVKKRWDNDWQPWYYIRPVVSLVCGGISWLFLEAGLLVLESQHEPTSTNLGFYTLAFIAGLNVDKFIAKIEQIAQATWGIDPSRSTKESQNQKES